MSYAGPERRRHRILVTKNSEYHLRGAVCVAVRESRGDWCQDHQAVGNVLEGSIGRTGTGGYLSKEGPEPEPGFRLCFSGDLLTSPLLTVRRPPKEAVSRYGHSAVAACA